MVDFVLKKCYTILIPFMILIHMLQIVYDIVCYHSSPALMVLLSNSSNKFSYWLKKYVLGTQKKDAQQYPLKTVYILLCGLNRHMQEKKQDFIN